MGFPLDGRYIPHLEEGQVIGQSIASLATSNVIVDLPTGHAKRIDVIVATSGNDVQVNLINYGASKNASDTASLGTVTAGNTGTFVHGPGAGEFVGQCCTLSIQNTNGQASGDAAVVIAYLIARS